MRSVGMLSLAAICCATTAQAQNDRPSVVTLGRGSIGGYVEGNTSQRFAPELQRFNLFFSAPIGQRFEFASELALTQRANAVAVEAAHLDFLLHPQMTLRGGILRPPVGTYNVNRDSPHWEFVDRPLVSTDIISTSNSELGFGAHGTVDRGDLTLSYDAYVTSGVPNSFVVSGGPVGQFSREVGQDVFGSPSLSGRVALKERLGEVGVSFYTGRDKAYAVVGDVIEDPRHRMLVAADFTTGSRGISVRGGVAYSKVSIQPSMKDVFADRQWGGHLDIIVPILRPSIGGLENAVVNGSLRLERIDYNRMNFNSAARNVFEDLNAVVAGLSFRPTQRTVVRANYRWHWFHDVLGNPTSRKAGFQLGFATYF